LERAEIEAVLSIVGAGLCMQSGLGFALQTKQHPGDTVDKGGMTRGFRLLSDQTLHVTVSQCSASQQRSSDSLTVPPLTDPGGATSSQHIIGTQQKDLGGRRSTEGV
jgi:hypothetical protein